MAYKVPMAAIYSQVPRQLLPMLATSTDPFDDPGCLFEVKWDGVRCLAAVEADGVRLWGREGANYSGRYPELEVLQRLPAGTVLDGELVMVRDGQPDFHALMARHARRPSRLPYFVETIRYVVFDLLHLGGRSLVDRPLSERRELLHEALPRRSVVMPCEGVVGKGRAYFKKVLKAGHEGVVAKRMTSRYTANQRGRAWQKIKPKIVMPCVVIGYHLTAGRLHDLVMASLVDGKLAYVGTVELGIDGRPETIKRLEGMRTSRPAVDCSLSARWVKPELLCVVQFAGWRAGGWRRDAVFAGWAE